MHERFTKVRFGDRNYLYQRTFDLGLGNVQCENDGLTTLEPHYLFEAGTIPNHSPASFLVLCECNHLHNICSGCAKTYWKCHNCGNTIMSFVF